MPTNHLGKILVGTCALILGACIFLFLYLSPKERDEQYFEFVLSRFARQLDNSSHAVVPYWAHPPTYCIKGRSQPVFTAQSFLRYLDEAFGVIGKVVDTNQFVDCPVETDVYVFSYTPLDNSASYHFRIFGASPFLFEALPQWGFVHFMSRPDDSSRFIALVGLRDLEGDHGQVEHALVLQEIYQSLSLGGDFITETEYSSLLDEPDIAQQGSSEGDTLAYNSFLRHNPLGLCRLDAFFLMTLEKIWRSDSSPFTVEDFVSIYRDNARSIVGNIEVLQSNPVGKEFMDEHCWEDAGALDEAEFGDE